MTPENSLGTEDFRAAILAAAEVYGRREFVVVGRGSLSASLPNSSHLLRMTEDIDLYPLGEDLDYAVLASHDSELGLQSDFFAKHGFYVQRVGDWTVMGQPVGWQERALRFDFDGVQAIVLHPLDLAYNKLEAGRPKDIDFMREGLNCNAYDYVEILEFIQKHAPDIDVREMILEKLRQSAD
jgi:hypothetical protein